MTDEQFEFLMAIDQYKRVNARPFPTWTEVLEVIKALGYRKVAPPLPLDQVASGANAPAPDASQSSERPPEGPDQAK
jgi:hypothetical protein